jgi:carbonic anhydrase
MKLQSVFSFAALAIAGLFFCSFAGEPAAPTADEAVRKLLEGNSRHATNAPVHPNQSAARRAEVAQGQHPFAAILACADSRVSPEVVFDQGHGDLFTVRVAGNIVDNASLGSLEYAAEHLHTPVIVVLGHEKCGAVSAALGGGHAPGHIHGIVEAIQPAVKETKGQAGDPLDNAVAANVRRVVKQLQAAGPILNELVKAGKLKIVGARYDLDTGKVEILP